MTKIKTFILGIWNKFSDESKTKIISSFNTALTAFSITILITLSSGKVEWSVSFLMAVIGSGIREAIKAVTSTFVPKRLGGRK